MKKTEEKAVTLVALVLTIIILLILATIGATAGISTIQSAKFTKYQNELKVMQNKINELNTKGNTSIGKPLTQQQKSILEQSEISSIIFKDKTDEQIEEIKNGFVYLDSDTILNELGLEGIDNEYLVNIKYRYVINLNGYEYNGKTYFMTDQLDNGLYNVDYGNQKKTGDFEVKVTYENNVFKIEIINIQYDGNVSRWDVKYQPENSSTWNTAPGTTFYIQDEGTYNVNLSHGDIDLGTKEIVLEKPREEDNINPTITVSPTSSTAKNKVSIKITVTDEGGSELSSSNSYQYYLSTSATELSGGEWTNYTSESAFTIGEGKTGTYYLFVKKVKDNDENESQSNGSIDTTIDNIEYHRYGTYVFDNVEPSCVITANVNSPTNADSITYTITFSKDVTGFTADDITVTGGTKGTLNGSGKVYTITITNGGSTTQTVNVSGSVCTDIAGNPNTASNTFTMTVDRTLPTVTLSPNGGTYTMPTSGNAKISTTITVSDEGNSGLNTIQYAWSQSNTTEPTSGWTTFESGDTIRKSDITAAGTWYLWTKVTDKAGNRAEQGKISNAFTVGANTTATNKITITLSPKGWTNGNVTGTVTYGSTLTSNKKAGYGTTLANAQTNASASTATTLTATANGYFYAEATDAAGNKVTASIQVTTIDKAVPTITVSPTSSTISRSTDVTITVAETGGSGLSSSNSYQYYLSTSGTALSGGTWTNYTSGTAFTIGEGKSGTYYLFVKRVTDNATNVSTASGSTDTAVSGTTYHRFGTYVFDSTSLTCKVTANVTSPTNASSITYTFTFSKNVTGFTADDITVTGGTKGTFSGSGTTYTLVVTNSGSTTQTVNVAANKCTDAAGNGNEASNTFTMTVDRTLPTVTLSPNGGTYTMPTSGNAKISTKLTATDEGGSGLNTLQYAWSQSNTTEPTSWTTFTSESTITKSDITAAGTWYLWTKVTDKAGNRAEQGKISNAFTVGANTTATNKITITLSPKGWTNGNVTGTVTYGSTLTSNKKAGYGTTLANAQENASTSTPTTLTATANGYFYAEATDAAGNKVTASIQVTTIDKATPTITVSPTSSTISKSTDVTITVAETGGSGLSSSNSYQYYLSTSGTALAGGEWTNYTSESAFTIGEGKTGTYYLFVKRLTDNATNVSTASGSTDTAVSGTTYHRFGTYVFDSTSLTCKVTANVTSPTNASSITYTFTFSKNVTGFTADDITVTGGTKGTFSGSGTTYTLVVTNSGSTTQTVNVAANKCTDAAGNGNEASNTFTMTVDRTLPTVTLSPNGGTYTMPTSGNAKISTKLTAADEGGSGLNTLQYAWSQSNTTEPTSWTTFTSESTITKTDITAAGTWYLWTKVTDKAGNRAEQGKISNAFTVGANTTATNKITITLSPKGWTNGNVTGKVTYGSTLTANKKAGYGTTLANAQTNASASTATTLTATANGYFYAEATDAAGNKVTASIQVTTIDKAVPTITVSPTSGTTAKTRNITITAADTGGSGLNTSNSYQYYLSTSVNGGGGSWVNYTSGTAFPIGAGITGTRYLFVKRVTDNATNISTASGSTDTAVSGTTYHRFGPFVFDNTAPTCTVTANKTSPTNSSSVTYTFTFSENVTGFTVDDVAVTNGTKSTFNGSGKTYTLIVTNAGTKVQTVSVAAGKCTDAAGNGNEASNTFTMTIDRTLPTVTLSPNGGTYTMPTSGNAKISTTITVSDEGNSGLNTIQYAWSQSNTTEPTSGWTTFESGDTIRKSDITAAGTWYLWTKVTDKAGNRAEQGKISNAFTVGANTTATNKITITLSPKGWTNGNVTGKVTYGSTLTANKKAGYGTTLANAQENASASTATTLTATANGYFYAEATDAAGNKVTASIQVTTIDKAVPTITVSPTSGTTAKTRSITITAADTGGSGLSRSNSYQYYLSTSRTALSGGSWTNYTSGKAFPIGAGITGTRYLFVKRVTDNATNISTASGSTDTAVSNVVYHRFGTYVFDNAAPTCKVTANKSSPTNASSITYTFTFSENVTGFTVDDITVTNGTKSGFCAITESKVYSVNVSNSGTCTQSVSVAANKCTDASGNGNTASNTLSMTIDRTAPTVKLSVTNQTCTSFTINITSAADNTGGVGLHSTAAYAFKISGGSWQGGGYVSNKSCTFSNLTASTSAKSYSVVVRVRDALGNYKDTTITASTLAAVAQITNTGAYYPSIQEAVNARNTSDVKLLVNRDESVTVPSGKTIVFSLNGKTWSNSSKTSTLINNATVSINGSGSINNNKGDYYAIDNKSALTISTGVTVYNSAGETVISTSKLTLNGGTIKSTEPGNGSCLTVNSGTFTMSSGTITTNGWGFVARGGSSVTITGGTIQTTKSDRYAIIIEGNATADIRNATISGPSYAISLKSVKDNNPSGVGPGKSCLIMNCNVSSGAISGKVIEVNTISGGYTLYLYDTFSEYSSVALPTWVQGEDSSQIKWYSANLIAWAVHGSRCWQYQITKANHNNKTGTYVTAVYPNNEHYIDIYVPVN